MNHIDLHVRRFLMSRKEKKLDLTLSELTDEQVRDFLVFAKDDDLSLKGIDLSNRDLHLLDLSEMDLREANLQDADMRATNLAEANLSAANLQRANLATYKE